MRNYIAVAFTQDRSAYEALAALDRLEAEGAITVHEAIVVGRRLDGEVEPRIFRRREPPLRGPGIGAAVGAAVGLLAGPIGVLIGGAVGVLGGAIDEAIRSEASGEHSHDVVLQMRPGTFALIADIHETEPGPVDARMAALGASVVRESHRDLVEEVLDKRQETRRAVSSSR